MKREQKNNLDERQEQKMLHIEHNGCWLAFYSLGAVILVQMLTHHGGLENLFGELTVMALLCLYILVDCLRNGLWDRQLKADAHTNLRVSLIAGGGLGLIYGVANMLHYHEWQSALLTAVLMFVSLTVLCELVLSLVTALYHKRKQKLDEQADQEEEE